MNRKSEDEERGNHLGEVHHIPWVCGNCGPSIIDRAFENLAAI